MHIGIAGPIATDNVAHLLSDSTGNLPKGYTGAPLTGALIGELIRQGHKVSAFTIDPSIYFQAKALKTSGPNFDFYICPCRPRAWRPNKFRLGRAVDGFAYEQNQILNAINTAKPDIIHAHWTYEFALAVIKSGIPHLITCHDAPLVILRYTRSLYRAIRYVMARRVFRKGKHFSTVSPYMASALQHYTEVPIYIVPNPIADYVIANGSPRKLPNTRRIGLICNGWDTRKNPVPALMAFAKLHSVEPSFELHLFGADFGNGEKAQQWSLRNKLSKRMVFHGAVPHKQLIEHLNDLDLLLHPSLEESFGVVIAEAMALGLPIVAGRQSGAVPWVVGIEDNTNVCCSAVLTDVSDPDAIVSAITKAFDQNYPDRSAAGCHRARQMFSLDTVTKAYLALYQNILQPVEIIF